MLNFNKGLAKLRNRGGRGQDGVVNLNGSLLTIRESAITILAKDIIDDLERRTGKPLSEIPLIEFQKDVEVRSQGRLFTKNELFAEIGRRQNAQIM